jgi:hypothetical protein
VSASVVGETERVSGKDLESETPRNRDQSRSLLVSRSVDRGGSAASCYAAETSLACRRTACWSLPGQINGGPDQKASANGSTEYSPSEPTTDMPERSPSCFLCVANSSSNPTPLPLRSSGVGRLFGVSLPPAEFGAEVSLADDGPPPPPPPPAPPLPIRRGEPMPGLVDPASSGSSEPRRVLDGEDRDGGGDVAGDPRR